MGKVESITNMEKQMKAYDFLKNYLEDLEYLASSGLDSINHSTNGTPVFKNKQEFVKYISTLKKCIGVKDNK